VKVGLQEGAREVAEIDVVAVEGAVIIVEARSSNELSVSNQVPQQQTPHL
jgi:hypothetical protein